jgi:hypothetical protein
VSLFDYSQMIMIMPNEADVDLLTRVQQTSQRNRMGGSSLSTDRAAHLQVCIKYSGSWSAARRGKVVHIVSRWHQENGRDFWENWSTGTDDTIESTARTVNLDAFFRVLRDRLTVESDGIVGETPVLNVVYP